jgi:hypothetical protein
VTNALAGTIKLVPGANDLAALHERAIPQKDQLCGPFWGALVLAVAGQPTDQDEVALRAGTTLAEGPAPHPAPITASLSRSHPTSSPLERLRQGSRGASRSCLRIL